MPQVSHSCVSGYVAETCSQITRITYDGSKYWSIVDWQLLTGDVVGNKEASMFDCALIEALQSCCNKAEAPLVLGGNYEAPRPDGKARKLVGYGFGRNLTSLS